GPMQSSAKATGRPTALASGSTSGFSDRLGSGPFSGRPKSDMTITRAPFSASSRVRGSRALDPRRVRDLSVCDGDGQIGAQQDTLAATLDITERVEVGLEL